MLGAAGIACINYWITPVSDSMNRRTHPLPINQVKTARSRTFPPTGAVYSLYGYSVRVTSTEYPSPGTGPGTGPGPGTGMLNLHPNLVTMSAHLVQRRIPARINAMPPPRCLVQDWCTPSGGDYSILESYVPCATRAGCAPAL